MYHSVLKLKTKIVKSTQLQLTLLAILLYMSLSILWKQTEAIHDEPSHLKLYDKHYEDTVDQQTIWTTNKKFILLWNCPDYSPFYFFGKGQDAFERNRCAFHNCYVTANKNLFDGDTTKFHAILFNGRCLDGMNMPKMRVPNQKYVYANMESSENVLVCDRSFDNFFNWTATYKLNSDLPLPYISITDDKNKIFGPKTVMVWSNTEREDNDQIVEKNLDGLIKNKSKTAAWFVSNCKTKNDRITFAIRLNNCLRSYNKSVDIYGDCSLLKCPRIEKQKCDRMLQEKYYFYLSLENSFAEDYVTEKLLTALEHYAVPIVFGGADYSRFLPPGSYLDGRKHKPDQLAKIMVDLMSNHTAYKKFFWWRKHYSFHDPSAKENVCNLCSALNNKTFFETKTVYEHFRGWWNPRYKSQCEKTN